MLQEPDSMEELVYFTRRVIEPKGKVVAWVFREKCPKCKKALMGKPQEDGKIKIRAKEYVCSECGYKEGKYEYENKLTCNIKYTCPYCLFEGEIQVPFKRRTYQGVPAIVFECSKCKGKIAITKKMKDPKEKGSSAGFDDD